METKIKNFLQSDFFILSIALLLGFLCHFFVTTEIVSTDKRVKDAKSLYMTALNLKDEPLNGLLKNSNKLIQE